MKVIFVKDLRGQGKKGDIKEVSDGYAKNYLFKNNVAVPYNSVNKARYDKAKEAASDLDKENIKKAEALKKKLEKELITFNVKADDSGKVFGSINVKNIIDALKEKGYEIEKHMIDLDKNIATLGNTVIDIELYKDIVAKLKVRLER